MNQCIAAYFFCANCKYYEDANTSGTSSNIRRNSKWFQCTANHFDFIFPTDKLLDGRPSEAAWRSKPFLNSDTVSERDDFSSISIESTSSSVKSTSMEEMAVTNEP